MYMYTYGYTICMGIRFPYLHIQCMLFIYIYIYTRICIRVRSLSAYKKAEFDQLKMAPLYNCHFGTPVLPIPDPSLLQKAFRGRYHSPGEQSEVCPETLLAVFRCIEKGHL